MAVICARSWEPSTLLLSHEGGAPVARKRRTQRLRRRGVSRKNQALRRRLARVAAPPDDHGQQWWEHFDALLRRPRMRLRPIDASVARLVPDTNNISQNPTRNALEHARLHAADGLLS